jgi:hypothetical protein
VKYINILICVKQAVWLNQLLHDIRHTKYLDDSKWTTRLHDDNQSTLALIWNPHIYKWSKHIDITHHHVHNLEKHNWIKINYISINEMIANGLIKPLLSPMFEDNFCLLSLRKLWGKNRLEGECWESSLFLWGINKVRSVIGQHHDGHHGASRSWPSPMCYSWLGLVCYSLYPST